ncbi:MAG: hypothetical protein O2782_09345, partial [bacterium]|nr:hypothetical protein [bacterium]
MDLMPLEESRRAASEGEEKYFQAIERRKTVRNKLKKKAPLGIMTVSVALGWLLSHWGAPSNLAMGILFGGILGGVLL